MVTANTTRGALILALSALIPACTGGVSVGGVGTDPGKVPAEVAPENQPENQQVPEAADLAYPGKGFIVHEWGTDTVVVGSDGSLQRGLQHEEEDLPGFVYNRIKAGSVEGSASVHVKMETPVTYFYADAPLTANVNVAFPGGILTQWYPAVQSFYPFITAPNAIPGLTEYKDPALDMAFPFASQSCSDKHGAIANGLLDWGSIEILAREESPAMVEAPLDQFTWSYAREVAANAIRVSGKPGAMTTPQSERFLFYRGLGDFELPVRVEAGADGEVVATNTIADAIGTVFVLNVGEKSGAFIARPDGIKGEGELTARAPSLESGMPIEAFVEALGAQVTDALDATGLYHDEAVAMVSTWKRQWFRTPGIRLLYLAPQAWTESSIPLTVSPAPEATVRVMMIRVEIITPELESADVAKAKMLAEESESSSEQAKAYFLGLGRFAEPRLRRAASLLGDAPYVAPLLAEIATAPTSIAAGE
jgi:hypothetical protein